MGTDRKVSLTLAERETIIRWDEDERVVYLYSASPVTWRKAERLGFQAHKTTTRQGVLTGKFYKFPFSVFQWGKKRRGVSGYRGQRFVRSKPHSSPGELTVESGSQDA